MDSNGLSYIDSERGRLMTTLATTTPQANGEAPLPRRLPKGLLPGSWTGQNVKLDYVGGDGAANCVSGCLADVFGAGPCIRTGDGGRVVVSWDRLVLVELIAS